MLAHNNPSTELQFKRWLLSITNKCNLSCGSCGQLCGHFPKNMLWESTVEELDRIINVLKRYTGPQNNWNELTIFGGEPTTHSRWAEVLEMLYSHDPVQFRINTNGRLGHTKLQQVKNITYYVDPHVDGQLFTTAFVAARDILKIAESKHYWSLAKCSCPIWKTEGAMVYNSKAYYCENAAAMDWLLYAGAHGWEITNENPFAKSDIEIEAQAEPFCQRCNWCLAEPSKQNISDKTIVTETNYESFPKLDLVQLTT